MLRRSVVLALAAFLVTLALSSKAQAWGCYRHVGYTHYGPVTGLHHYGYTGYHYGGYGGYGGYHYGGYHYGGYGYGDYRYGYYRRW
jgi:hypothetical protein